MPRSFLISRRRKLESYDLEPPQKSSKLHEVCLSSFFREGHTEHSALQNPLFCDYSNENGRFRFTEGGQHVFMPRVKAQSQFGIDQFNSFQCLDVSPRHFGGSDQSKLSLFDFRTGRSIAINVFNHSHDGKDNTKSDHVKCDHLNGGAVMRKDSVTQSYNNENVRSHEPFSEKDRLFKPFTEQESHSFLASLPHSAILRPHLISTSHFKKLCSNEQELHQASSLFYQSFRKTGQEYKNFITESPKDLNASSLPYKINSHDINAQLPVLLDFSKHTFNRGTTQPYLEKQPTLSTAVATSGDIIQSPLLKDKCFDSPYTSEHLHISDSSASPTPTEGSCKRGLSKSKKSLRKDLNNEATKSIKWTGGSTNGGMKRDPKRGKA